MSKCVDSGYVANIVTSFIEIPGRICSSIYLSGCTFNCSGCQNIELQNPHFGSLMSCDDVLSTINKNYLAKWVCFLGGEPLCQYDFLLNLCKQINKPIGIYTGNTFSCISKKYPELLSIDNVKFIKSGQYISTLTKINEFPITSNQEIHLKYNTNWYKCVPRNIGQISNEITNLDLSL